MTLEPSMPTGTVKSYSLETGYGFLVPDDGGRDVFVHGRAVDRAELGTLHEGQRVSYRLLDRKPASKGQSAEDLKILAPMTTGEVLWFDHVGGYGFLQPNDGGDRVFVHVTSAQKAGLRLHEGDRVSYDVVTDQRSHRPHAQNLKALT